MKGHGAAPGGPPHFSALKGHLQRASGQHGPTSRSANGVLGPSVEGEWGHPGGRPGWGCSRISGVSRTEGPRGDRSWLWGEARCRGFPGTARGSGVIQLPRATGPRPRCGAGLSPWQRELRGGGGAPGPPSCGAGPRAGAGPLGGALQKSEPSEQSGGSAASARRGGSVGRRWVDAGPEAGAGRAGRAGARAQGLGCAAMLQGGPRLGAPAVRAEGRRRSLPRAASVWSGLAAPSCWPPPVGTEEVARGEGGQGACRGLQGRIRTAKARAWDQVSRERPGRVCGKGAEALAPASWGRGGGFSCELPSGRGLPWHPQPGFDEWLREGTRTLRSRGGGISGAAALALRLRGLAGRLLRPAEAPGGRGLPPGG